jgi:PPOX class probable F420-dependent enzyme
MTQITLPQDIINFLSAHHKAVFTTYRKNGAAQLSVIVCGLLKGRIVFSTARNAKYWNLKRNPRCSLLVSRDDWRRYVALDGQAQIANAENTEPEMLRLELREVFRAATGREHPDWAQYDADMLRDRRAIIIVQPEHFYGKFNPV